MNDDKNKYEGWTNRETWAVKLHWDSNEGDYISYNSEAKEYKTHGSTLYEFSEFLRESYDELEQTVMDGVATEEAKRMVQDVGSAWRVDWREIAEAYYNDVDV